MGLVLVLLSFFVVGSAWAAPATSTTPTATTVTLASNASSIIASLPSCIPPTATAGLSVGGVLNYLLEEGGSGFKLSLCPQQTYTLDQTLVFTAQGQEISTYGYPAGSDRAVLVVGNNTYLNLSTAIQGNGASNSNIAIKNIIVNGNRGSSPPTPSGNALIEIGGANSNQTVSNVKSFDCRGWSCLHIAEGPFTCTGAQILNNDIGPCGLDANSEWADGISLSCKNSIVEGNTIADATDGAIVVFGAPGSTIRNNTIYVENSTLLGGINMVDYAPWDGDYSGTVVEENYIFGAFADETGNMTKGMDGEDVIIKIGISMGPRVWFYSATQWPNDYNHGGKVLNNTFSGAFGYAMAAAHITQFTVTGNKLEGNTSFIGSRGPNCTAAQLGLANPEPFVIQLNATNSSTIQGDFVDGLVLGMICIEPPTNGAYWPYGSWEQAKYEATASVSSVSASASATSGTTSEAFHLESFTSLPILLLTLGMGFLML